jgi:hypothetical protein
VRFATHAPPTPNANSTRGKMQQDDAAMAPITLPATTQLSEFSRLSAPALPARSGASL